MVFTIKIQKFKNKSIDNDNPEGFNIIQWNLLSTYWDMRMKDFGDWYYRNIIHPEIFKLISNIESIKILDAGCSTGSLSRALATKGADVLGVDFSSEMIKKAKTRYLDKKIKLEYRCFDLRFLSQKIDYKFNNIILNFSLQDIKHYRLVLKEFRKCITEDGKLIIILEHPFFVIFDELHVTTRRFWFGEEKKPKNLMDIIKRYKKQQKIEINWDNSLSTISYLHTLEEYTLALFEANFFISRILEPVIPKNLANRGPKNNISHIVPMFLIIEAIPQK